MVEVKNLTKRYGNVTVVDDISFTVDSGEILGFLGPNGAGKSTTMNMITGYISSSSGTVTVNGAEVLDNPKKVKGNIGYLPEIPPLYVDMTVRKYLEFMFDLKKVKLPKKEHISEVMRLVKISDVSERIIKHLSKGYRQRVGFAQALLGNPPILILDEPTAGLDPRGREEILSLIKRYHEEEKVTLIMVSHSMTDVSRLCSRILVMNHSRLVMDGTPDDVFMNGDRLMQAGLALPPCAELAERLRGAGFDIPADAYRPEALKQAILDSLGRGKSHA